MHSKTSNDINCPKNSKAQLTFPKSKRVYHLFLYFKDNLIKDEHAQYGQLF